jgi:RimJ/RimL family protein N-acetyltransferase
VSERQWVLVGDQIGLTAPVKEEYLERWDRYNDPFFGAYLGYGVTSTLPQGPTLPPFIREQREGMWERLTERIQLVFDLRLLEDQRCIGEASWVRPKWPEGSAELAMAIYDPADRSKGYGREAVGLMCAYAFDVVGLNRVEVTTLATNEAVMKIAERVVRPWGARRVGIARQAMWAFGRRHDTLILDLLKSDFPPHPATAAFREVSEAVDEDFASNIDPGEVASSATADGAASG